MHTDHTKRRLTHHRAIYPLNHSRGVTLVELMVLSAIFAILITMVAQNIFGINNESRVIEVNQNLRSIEGALSVYRKELGDYPSNEEGLSVLIKAQSTPDWKGPYLRADLLSDPWNRPYYYERTPSHYRLYTLGADGKEGGTHLNEDISLTRQIIPLEPVP